MNPRYKSAKEDKPVSYRPPQKGPRPRRPQVQRYLDDTGMSFIKEHEGRRMQVYDDLAPYNQSPDQPVIGNLTAGYGHKLLPHETMPVGTPISEEQAHNWLRNDLDQAELAVQRGVQVPISTPTYNALTSFAYNAGSGNLARSGVLNAINTGDIAQAQRILQSPRYTGAKRSKRPLPGLVKRRAQEAQMMEQPASRYGYVPATYAPPVAPKVMRPQPLARMPEEHLNTVERFLLRMGLLR